MAIELDDMSVNRSRSAPLPADLTRIVERMVQIGRVMAVDRAKHAARVKFEDTGIRSGWLKIIDARPYIPDYEGGESDKVRWEDDVLFGETEEETCMSESEPAPEPEPEPEDEEDGEGGDPEPEPEPEPEPSGECEPHSHELKIRMWLPKIGDRVVCLYLPIRNGDGFILGKIW